MKKLQYVKITKGLLVTLFMVLCSQIRHLRSDKQRVDMENTIEQIEANKMHVRIHLADFVSEEQAYLLVYESDEMFIDWLYDSQDQALSNAFQYLEDIGIEVYNNL